MGARVALRGRGILVRSGLAVVALAAYELSPPPCCVPQGKFLASLSFGSPGR